MEVKGLGICTLNSNYAWNNLESLHIPQVKTLGKNHDWKICFCVEQEAATVGEGLGGRAFFKGRRDLVLCKPFHLRACVPMSGRFRSQLCQGSFHLSVQESLFRQAHLASPSP